MLQMLIKTLLSISLHVQFLIKFGVHVFFFVQAAFGKVPGNPNRYENMENLYFIYLSYVDENLLGFSKEELKYDGSFFLLVL